MWLIAKINIRIIIMIIFRFPFLYGKWNLTEERIWHFTTHALLTHPSMHLPLFFGFLPFLIIFFLILFNISTYTSGWFLNWNPTNNGWIFSHPLLYLVGWYYFPEIFFEKTKTKNLWKVLISIVLKRIFQNRF